TEVRFSDAQGVTLYVGRRTFLTAMAAIASGKKVRLRAVETMKNLEKNARKKGAFHHQLMRAPNRDRTARCRPLPKRLLGTRLSSPKKLFGQRFQSNTRRILE